MAVGYRWDRKGTNQTKYHSLKPSPGGPHITKPYIYKIPVNPFTQNEINQKSNQSVLDVRGEKIMKVV